MTNDHHTGAGAESPELLIYCSKCHLPGTQGREVDMCSFCDVGDLLRRELVHVREVFATTVAASEHGKRSSAEESVVRYREFRRRAATAKNADARSHLREAARCLPGFVRHTLLPKIEAYLNRGAPEDLGLAWVQLQIERESYRDRDLRGLPMLLKSMYTMSSWSAAYDEQVTALEQEGHSE